MAELGKQRRKKAKARVRKGIVETDERILDYSLLSFHKGPNVCEMIIQEDKKNLLKDLEANTG